MRRTALYAALGLGAAAIIATTVAYSFWSEPDEVARNWRTAIRSCAQTDILGENEFVFFGPSNNIPPGSIWRKSNDGRLFLRWNVNDYEPLRGDALTQKGAWVSCRFATNVVGSADPGVFLDGDLSAVSAKLSTALKKSTSARIGFDQWRLDLLKEGPYLDAVRQVDRMARDLGAPDRIVMHKGILIRGFFLELGFRKDLSAEMDALVDDPAIVGGSKLRIERTADSSLRIASASEVYVAGAFAEYSRMQLQSEGPPPRLLPVPVRAEAPLGRELPN